VSVKVIQIQFCRPRGASARGSSYSKPPSPSTSRASLSHTSEDAVGAHEVFVELVAGTQLPRSWWVKSAPEPARRKGWRGWELRSSPF